MRSWALSNISLSELTIMAAKPYQELFECQTVTVRDRWIVSLAP
jgi:hypothetical protein